MDETAVLLPYKLFYALNEEVLYKPDKQGQSFMAVSKYFQGSCSQCLTEIMYVSVLVRYDSTQEDVYKSLHPEMENLSYQVYTPSRLPLSQRWDGCSTHMNTLIFLVSPRIWRASYIISNQMALSLPLASSSRIYGMVIKPPRPPFLPPVALPLWPSPLPNPSIKW